MLKSLVKAVGFIAGLALSGAIYAVGMGGINVSSSLGEPLKAEIELVAFSKADKGNLSAHLASPDIFKSAGMDYPYGLPALKFQIKTKASGESYVKLTSDEPVKEPFVSLLVELDWSSGKLLREYTFLLDPPGYQPEQPQAQVSPVVPSAPAEPARQPVSATSETSAMRSTAPMDERIFTTATVAASAKTSNVTTPAKVSNVSSGVIKVKRGDTLSKIAREIKPSEISLERMLVALYRANTNEFDGKNMNRLRTGKILRMPERSDLDGVEQADAVNEIHAQAADWNAYRQKLAAAASPAAEQAPRQVVSGKISTTVADKAPPSKESAKEVMRLSKGAAPGDKTSAGGNAEAMQDKVHSMEEEAIAKGKAIKESRERIAMLEKNIKEMQSLLELKSQAMTPAKPVPGKAETKPNGKPALPAAPPAVTTAPLPAKPEPAPAPKVVPPPPSLMDEILDEPLYLAAGAAVLLALGGLGFVMTRRKKTPGSKTKDIDGIGSHIAAPVVPSPETGDFTGAMAATAAPGEAQPGDADPISEADLFLNFGRDTQAEEVLKDALAKDPSNNKIQLKLLSIYADRKDAKAFSVMARQVQDSGNAAVWAQAAEMGRKLEPNNPLYGGADGEQSTAVQQEEEAKGEAAGLDFDLGLSEPEEAGVKGDAAVDVSAASGAASMPEVDFDLSFGGGEEAVAATTANEGAATPDKLDFDLTASNPASESGRTEVTASNPDDLVFDVTSSYPAAEAAPEEKTVAAPEKADEEKADKGFDLTLDFPVADEPPKSGAAAAAASEMADIGLGDIDLKLDDAAPAPAAEVKNAHWHDVATKLDLAKAYQEMGDAAGAREILGEVLNEGDEQQRAAAEAMMQQLPPA